MLLADCPFTPPLNRLTRFMRALPPMLRCPATAMFGLGSPREMVAWASAVRDARGAEFSLHVFHWQLLEERKAEWMHQIQRRWNGGGGGRQRPGRRRRAFLDVAHFHALEERDSPDPRASWQEAVERLVVSDPTLRFGLVVHYGAPSGLDILRDFRVVEPLVAEDVVVVLMKPAVASSAARVRAMVGEQGWHSIFIGGFALLQKTPFAVPTEGVLP